MRNLDRENSFQLQVAPSNTFVEKCKEPETKTLWIFRLRLKNDQRWKRSTLRTEVRRVPTY